MRSLLPAALAFMMQLSCFNIDPSTVTFTCDPAQAGNCPEGQTCSAATRSCSVPRIPSQPSTVPVRACTSGMGYDVSVAGGATGKLAFACPVTYSQLPMRTADAQCIGGTHVCTDADSVDLNACDAIKGAFFIAAVPAHRSQDGSVSCGAAGVSSIPLWSGCGGDEPITIACNGFNYAAECNLLPQGFTCTGPKITNIANAAPLSGVLCCL